MFRSHNPMHRGAEPSSLVESRKPIVEFSRNALPFALKHGDWPTPCCDGETFEITSVAPDGVSRTTCEGLVTSATGLP
jgi:hypothetical protein